MFRCFELVRLNLKLIKIISILTLREFATKLDVYKTIRLLLHPKAKFFKN